MDIEFIQSTSSHVKHARIFLRIYQFYLRIYQNFTKECILFS